jgi:hypothetical protein
MGCMLVIVVALRTVANIAHNSILRGGTGQLAIFLSERANLREG